MSIFHNIAPNFTLLQKNIIFQVYLQLFRQLLHPYKFRGMDMSGILFFIFASCELLTLLYNSAWVQWLRGPAGCRDVLFVDIFQTFNCYIISTNHQDQFSQAGFGDDVDMLLFGRLCNAFLDKSFLNFILCILTDMTPCGNYMRLGWYHCVHTVYITVNGSQLAKMKKSIPDRFLP